MEEQSLIATNMGMTAIEQGVRLSLQHEEYSSYFITKKTLKPLTAVQFQYWARSNFHGPWALLLNSNFLGLF